MSDTLAGWLARLETRHPKKIDLGLGRVQTVLEALDLMQPPFPVITVAGTNGKGSAVAMLTAIYEHAGYLTGAYTSPHLIRYNERICVGRQPLDDARILEAFRTVESARGEVSLSYFEYSTVAALVAFRRNGAQLAVLEVGLGGRLDAVNAVASDAALITSIGLDHQSWLGPDREAIGAEKAGVYRAGRPAVLAEADPPASIRQVADRIGASITRIGIDFDYAVSGDGWRWSGPGGALDRLPRPSLAGEVQLVNAAGVLAVVDALGPRLPVSLAAVRAGLADIRLAGRFQEIPGEITWLLDVAHNAESAQVLARTLRQRPPAGRNLAILGMLDDKPLVQVVQSLDGLVAEWIACTPDSDRATAAATVAAHIAGSAAGAVTTATDVVSACRLARSRARPGDRIVVLGSFYTVGPALQWLQSHAGDPDAAVHRVGYTPPRGAPDRGGRGAIR